MKLIMWTTMVLLFTTGAFAELTPDQQKWKDRTVKRIESAAKRLDRYCKCRPELNVSYEELDKINSMDIRNCYKSAATGIEKFCMSINEKTSKNNSALLCKNLKTVEIRRGGGRSSSYANGILSLTYSSKRNVNCERDKQITALLKEKLGS